MEFYNELHLWTRAIEKMELKRKIKIEITPCDQESWLPNQILVLIAFISKFYIFSNCKVNKNKKIIILGLKSINKIDHQWIEDDPTIENGSKNRIKKRKIPKIYYLF